MGMGIIEKHSSVYPSYAVKTSSTDADLKEVLVGSMSTGMVYVPSGSSITTLTFYAAEKSGGTFLPAYTYDGTAAAITSITAGRAYEFPPGLYAAEVLKIVGNAAGTIAITLKS